MVEPLGGQVFHPVLIRARPGAAVVAAGEPGDLDRGAGGRDPLGVEIRLGEREERVDRALDQQRRRLDPVEHGGRAGFAQQVEGGLVGGAGGGHRQVGGAHVGGEAPAGRVVTAGAGPEEDPGPALLEHAGRGGLRGLREEGAAQVVPGDRRDDRVDPLILPGEEQGEGAAVGAADHPDPWVAGRVGLHLGALRQPVEQALRVLDLVVRAVQVDLAGAAAEALRGPGEHGVAPGREGLGIRADRVLAAAEAVREQDRRHFPGPLPGQQEAGVEIDRLVVPGAGADRDPKVLGGPGGALGQHRPDRRGGDQHEHDRGGDRLAPGHPG